MFHPSHFYRAVMTMRKQPFFLHWLKPPVNPVFPLTKNDLDFSDTAVAKNPPAHTGDASLTPGSRRSPGVGNGNPLQDSCLENSMDEGAWWVIVHRVTKSQTRLSH